MASGKKKSRKLRVSLKKNRGKRTREGDLTRRSLEDMDAVADLSTGERISGKGTLSRRRTILATENESGELVRDLDATELETGRVLQAVGANHCRVQLDVSRIVLDCTIRRLVRNIEREDRNAVVAGDRVSVLVTGQATGVIERIEPRTSSLSRVSRGKAQVIVANVDRAVIVVSAGEPALKPGLIDRFLCSTEKGGIQGIVCINKCDLVPTWSLAPVVGEFSHLGYSVVLTDALSGQGVGALRELLVDHESVFTGQSGVGKSTLLNALDPRLKLATGKVSSDTQKGRHTTRVAQLLALSGGGYVVDTPGIRQLRLWDVSPMELENLFIEFRRFVPDCHFPDCTHVHESGCAVKDAVAREEIAPRRYASYVRIFHDDDE